MNRCHGFLVAVALLAALLPASVSADVVSHNGLELSGGTGDVPVFFMSGTNAQDPTIPENVWVTGSAFFGNVTHEIVYEFAGDEPPVFVFQVLILNATSTPWDQFSVSLTGVDFRSFPFGDFAPEVNPVGSGIVFGTPAGSSVSVGNSTIERNGENSVLSMQFDDAVDPNEAFRLFFTIDDVGAPSTQFTLRQGPQPLMVPAPGAVVLAMIAFPALGWFQRRSR
jgi:hypothetical protein